METHYPQFTADISVIFSSQTGISVIFFVSHCLNTSQEGFPHPTYYASKMKREAINSSSTTSPTSPKRAKQEQVNATPATPPLPPPPPLPHSLLSVKQQQQELANDGAKLLEERRTFEEMKAHYYDNLGNQLHGWAVPSSEVLQGRAILKDRIPKRFVPLASWEDLPSFRVCFTEEHLTNTPHGEGFVINLPLPLGPLLFLKSELKNSLIATATPAGSVTLAPLKIPNQSLSLRQWVEEEMAKKSRNHDFENDPRWESREHHDKAYQLFNKVLERAVHGEINIMVRHLLAVADQRVRMDRDLEGTWTTIELALGVLKVQAKSVQTQEYLTYMFEELELVEGLERNHIRDQVTAQLKEVRKTEKARARVQQKIAMLLKGAKSLKIKQAITAMLNNVNPMKYNSDVHGSLTWETLLWERK